MQAFYCMSSGKILPYAAAMSNAWCSKLGAPGEEYSDLTRKPAGRFRQKP